MPEHGRTSFENLYAGQPRWEIGQPQVAILAVADRITGSVLDTGCGTGENALFLARQGQQVMGIDFLAEPITLAKQKAAERGLTVTFREIDALALKDLPEVFDSAIDSGLFRNAIQFGRNSWPIHFFRPSTCPCCSRRTMGMALCPRRGGSSVTPSRRAAVRPLREGVANALAPLALAEPCRGRNVRRRHRALDPVPPIHVFLLQILHGNTSGGRWESTWPI
ncbi:class I SAM-dependent methyltransferase [Limnoglobus roseus]|uniref:Class I SAM-dependent methyltransferase n=1 Tax=Limnoglobus roseus TaxID=2598579 RepID=A0A5C1AVN2_9BACT|nr:class I SAM-dependent methyltransferase [Limnoglobus roseus]QEL20868.1 class I SAM-dependent methyltransferase [Limnoglobus roseus]